MSSKHKDTPHVEYKIEPLHPPTLKIHLPWASKPGSTKVVIAEITLCFLFVFGASSLWKPADVLEMDGWMGPKNVLQPMFDTRPHNKNCPQNKAYRIGRWFWPSPPMASSLCCYRASLSVSQMARLKRPVILWLPIFITPAKRRCSISSTSGSQVAL